MYVADVSKVVHMKPNDILWKLSLADGLRYQREYWLREGAQLMRRKRSGAVKSAKCYFKA